MCFIPLQQFVDDNAALDLLLYIYSYISLGNG